MSLDDILMRVQEGQELQVPESWTQGRITFGGLTAAVLYEAVAKDVDPLRKLRSIEVSFTRPLEAFKSFDIQVEILA